MPNPEPNRVEIAREEILAWLQAGQRNPFFLRSHAGPAASADNEIVARFLSWVRPVGFTLEVANDGTNTEPNWTAIWRSYGDRVEDVSHTTNARSRDDAGLLACTALLQNETCRSRLP